METVVDTDPVDDQVTPLSVENSHDVIAAPPFDPAVTAADSAASRPEIESNVGADGVVAGVALVAVLAVPLPWA
ncbi:MAG: hypothetical protein ACKORY_08415, partial [Actinomycetota bacterium]